MELQIKKYKLQIKKLINVKLQMKYINETRTFVFVEPLPSEGALAVRAHEMFRVPLLIYSGYRASFYRLLARCTYAGDGEELVQ